MKVRGRRVLATFGWWQWTLLAVFLVALVLAGMFGVRTVRRAVYWRLHQEEPIARWMTVNYVAHSYSVPPEVLFRALGLPEPRPPARPDRRPLSEIATAQGKTFDQIRATLQNAITTARPSPPRPHSPRPPATIEAGPERTGLRLVRGLRAGGGIRHPAGRRHRRAASRHAVPARARLLRRAG